jgi:hypothetical protein
MSNLYDMRQVIQGCISRQTSSFNTGTMNFVDIAINNAIIYAQRKCDFEWNKGVVKMVANPFGRIDQCTDVDSVAVTIKRIIKTFGLVDPELHKNKSLPYLSRTSQIADKTDRMSHGHSGNPNVDDRPVIIHDGVKVYHSPAIDGEHDLFFYAVKWMPRLLKEEDTNFLLLYGFDFIMYRAIIEINFFIKEEERFQVNSAMVADAWNSLLAWDASLISPTETEIEL